MIYYSTNPIIKQRVTEFGYYLYDPKKECVYELNKTAFHIWQLCKNKISKKQLVKNISKKYPDVEENDDFVQEIEESLSVMVEDELMLFLTFAEPGDSLAPNSLPKSVAGYLAQVSFPLGQFKGIKNNGLASMVGENKALSQQQQKQRH